MSAPEVTFLFEDKPAKAVAGDTIASALYRTGRRVFSRSFKYHRPRGLLCGAGVCPNCMMNVDGVPNVRTCTVPVRAGMIVRPQNAWPSLDADFLALAQYFKAFMPVGWYYKVFTSKASWKAVEPMIRRVAGLGDPPTTPPADHGYEHSHVKCEIAVIGGGPSGMGYALELAAQGGRVLLVEKEAQLGGHLRYRGAAPERDELVAAVKRNPAIEVITDASCFGIYEGNLIGVVQRNPCQGVVERLIHVRAARIAVATGAYEAPLLFLKNDLPGIMLSTGVQRLIRLHGIKPGERAVIVGAGERASELESDLKSAGVSVVAIVASDRVVSARGSRRVTGLLTRDFTHACDLVVVCGHWVPDAGLLHQAGGHLRWDGSLHAFLPADLPDHVIAIGSVTGRSPAISNAAPPNTVVPARESFVCLCADATAGDMADAVEEGFEQIELVKRYTTATMGPCQGKMCQINTIGLCAKATGHPIGQIGVTTSRPPNPSVSLGALAGPRHHPIRRTPLHEMHEALDAVWLDMGDWKRPRFYRTKESADELTCVRGEYRAVRERAGIIDVSTLGKLEVKGRDVGRLLDKVYTSRLSDLKPGRTRYAVMCDEAGVMLDDGTVSRLSDQHFFITTTTGNLDFVEQWLLWWSVGTGWDVHVTNVTPGLASINLAGPAAREILQTLTTCDLESKAFPYMACREAIVAGVSARLFRIGFVGETGWEIHFAAEYGPHVWQAFLEAGADAGMRPFGVEAQRLLRLEKRHVIIGVDTDALTNPYAAEMAWIAKLDKPDFVGRKSLVKAAEESPRDVLTGFIMREKVVPEDGAPVVLDGKPVGRVTSARFSPIRDAGIGLAWMPRELAADGATIFIRVLGGLVKADVVHSAAFYDPEGVRLRQ